MAPSSAPCVGTRGAGRGNSPCAPYDRPQAEQFALHYSGVAVAPAMAIERMGDVRTSGGGAPAPDQAPVPGATPLPGGSRYVPKLHDTCCDMLTRARATCYTSCALDAASSAKRTYQRDPPHGGPPVPLTTHTPHAPGATGRASAGSRRPAGCPPTNRPIWIAPHPPHPRRSRRPFRGGARACPDVVSGAISPNGWPGASVLRCIRLHD